MGLDLGRLWNSVIPRPPPGQPPQQQATPQPAWNYQTQGMPSVALDYFRNNPMGGTYTDPYGSKWQSWSDIVPGSSWGGDSGVAPPVEHKGYIRTVGDNPFQERYSPGGSFTDTYDPSQDEGWLNEFTGPLAVLGFGLGANFLFGGAGAGAGAGAADAAAMYGVEPGMGAGAATGGAGAAGAAGASDAWGYAGAGAADAGSMGMGGGAAAAGAGGSMAGISDFITPQTVGAVLGAINGSRGTETTQRAEPWAGVQPALLDLYGRGQNFMANQGQWPSYFPGSTVAPQSQTTQQALQALIGRAQSGMGNMFGPGFLDAAQQQGMQTAQGGYLNNPSTSMLSRVGAGEMLNANPYVDAMFNRAAGAVGKQFKNAVMPGVASMFEGSGRYGSEAMRNQVDTAQENFGTTLENLGTSIYGGNYANERLLQQQALSEMGTQFGRERANMMQATNMAPNLAGADYTDLQSFMGAGDKTDLFNQRMVDDQVARHNFTSQLPQNMLGFYANLLSGAGNLGRTQTMQEQGDPFAGALGGAMIANSIFGGSRQQQQQPIIRDSSWDSLFNSD